MMGKSVGRLDLFRLFRGDRSLMENLPEKFIRQVGTQLAAAMIVGFGWLVTPIPWSYVALLWGYCLIWIFIEDWFKLYIYHHLAMTGKGHKAFLVRIKGFLHSQY
jgi:hypothetical protein